jgi:MFS family permease
MPTPFAALRYRDYAAFALARFCATLSWQMLTVAAGWQVYQITRDPLDLGLLGLAQFLPFFLLVLPAGHVADHADRRLVLIGAYIVEALCAALLLWFTFARVESAWPAFLAMGMFGIGRAFWMPTAQAITPNLVPHEVFPAAMALNASLFQTAVIVGPALGGLLLLFGPEVAYGTALGLLLVVVLAIASIKPIRAAKSGGSFELHAVLEGLRFVVHRRVLLGAISLDLFAVLFGGAMAMIPVYASDVLHVSAAGFGALRAAPGVGAAVTAALITVWPVQRHVGLWMFAGVTMFGIATIVFGISTVFWVSLLALFLAGMSDMVSVFVRALLVQLETPDHIRGRVSAVSSMFIGASNELGEFESGVTARWFGVVRSVVIGGIATLLVVATYLKLFPELRRMDRFPQPARKAEAPSPDAARQLPIQY